LRVNSSLISNWQKSLTKGRVEVFISPFTLHTTWPTSHKRELRVENKSKLISPLAKANPKRSHLYLTPHWVIDLQVEVSSYKIL